jgi:hydrogenase-4 component E
MNSGSYPLIFALDALTGALFLLTAIGVVGTRQVLASLQLFIVQSLLLTLSALLLGIALGSVHLFAVAAITIATKTLLIPWLLRHTVSSEVYRTREIERVLNIPSSLLVAAALVVLAYVVANPLLRAVAVPFAPINLPLGVAAMFLGVFTVAVRREAVPQLLGLLAIENGVFFAGVAIVPSLPVIAELAAAVDVPVSQRPFERFDAPRSGGVSRDRDGQNQDTSARNHRDYRASRPLRYGPRRSTIVVQSHARAGGYPIDCDRDLCASAAATPAGCRSQCDGRLGSSQWYRSINKSPRPSIPAHLLLFAASAGTAGSPSRSRTRARSAASDVGRRSSRKSANG